MRAVLTIVSLKNLSASHLHFRLSTCQTMPKPILGCDLKIILDFSFSSRGLIGHGKAHIHTCVSIAQAQAEDAKVAGLELPTTIAAFASLGSCGEHASSEERDLHRWLGKLHGIQVEPYSVRMNLEVGGLVFHKCFKLNCHHRVSFVRDIFCVS